MKQPKKNKPSVKVNPAIDYPSFQPTKSLADVTTDFVSKQKQSRKHNGDNDHLQDFLNVAKMITENYKSFSFNDFLALTRSLDTPASALTPLFHAWLDELDKGNRLKKVSGCYDWQTYSFK